MPGGIELCTTQTGLPGLCIDGKQVHSLRDPLREATRLAAGIPDETSCIILFGLGLGYLAEAVVTRRGVSPAEDFTLIVLEAEPELIGLAKKTRGLEGVFSSPSVYIISPGQEDRLPSLISAKGSKPLILKNPALVSRSEAWYAEQEALIDLINRRDQTNAATKAKFARRWIRNTARNATLTAEIPGINALHRLFEGVPALLVAAGPSLDSIKASLKDLRERCVIVAVDTALRACLDAGCVPDFVLAVDPQFWNARHLDHVDSASCTLVSELALWPALWQRPWKERFLFSSLFPLGSWLEERIAPKGRLAAGGSVATSAWDFCRYLGCRTIYLAGLDLAYPFGRTHMRGATFEERSLESATRITPAEYKSFLLPRMAQARRVEARAGGAVLCDARMKMYIAWFQRVFAEDRETVSLSVGAAGAAIKGLGTIALKDILALESCRGLLDRKRSERRRETEREWKARETDRREIMEKTFETLKEKLRELTDSCSLAVDACQKALEALGDAEKAPESSAAKPLVDRAFAACDGCEALCASETARDIAGFLFPDTDSIEAGVPEDKGNKLRWHLAWSQALWRELGSSAAWQLEVIVKNTQGMEGPGRYLKQVGFKPQT